MAEKRSPEVLSDTILSPEETALMGIAIAEQANEAHTVYQAAEATVKEAWRLSFINTNNYSDDELEKILGEETVEARKEFQTAEEEAMRRFDEFNDFVNWAGTLIGPRSRGRRALKHLAPRITGVIDNPDHIDR